MSDRLDRKKIQRKATIKFLNKLTQEAKQLAQGVDSDTKHKLNCKKEVITNKSEEFKRLDNKIMDLSMNEEEITNIMVAGTEFGVEIQETLSVIEEVLQKNSECSIQTIQYILKENLIKVTCLPVRHLGGKPSNYHRLTSQSFRAN